MFLATNKNNVRSCLCSFNGAPQAEEEVKDKGERRHSHTILSMTDSLTLPLLSSPTSLPRTSKTNMGKLSPWICTTPSMCWNECVPLITFCQPPSDFLPVPSPVGGPPRMTRSNSIPTQDTSLELYGASPLGSTLSLAERPRSMGMVRSGSFRDKDSDESKPSKF